MRIPQVRVRKYFVFFRARNAWTTCTCNGSRRVGPEHPVVLHTRTSVDYASSETTNRRRSKNFDHKKPLE